MIPNDYAELEKLLRLGVSEVRMYLPSAVIEDCEEYLSYGEYGVCYDLLRDALRDMAIAMPATLRQAAKIMMID